MKAGQIISVHVNNYQQPRSRCTDTHVTHNVVSINQTAYNGHKIIRQIDVYTTCVTLVKLVKRSKSECQLCLVCFNEGVSNCSTIK